MIFEAKKSVQIKLRGLDSNQDNILQRDAYYRYTTPQVRLIILQKGVGCLLTPTTEDAWFRSEICELRVCAHPDEAIFFPF